MGENLQAF
jgi:Bardet-Biedl syndrome 4 protein